MPEISKLPAASSVEDADEFPITQADGTTRRGSAAQVRANAVKNNQNNTFTKAQRGAFVDLLSAAASVAINLNDSNNYKHALTENTTLAAPTNPVEGQSGVIVFTQHAGVAKTLAFNGFWKTANGAGMGISTALGSINTMGYVINPGAASATCSMLPNVS